MPSAYSEDLRKRVVTAYHERKGTQSEIAEIFGISESSLRCYLRLEEKTGSLAPKEYKRGPHPVIAEKGLQGIKEWVERSPDIMLSELCALYKMILQPFFRQYEEKRSVADTTASQNLPETNILKLNVYVYDYKKPLHIQKYSAQLVRVFGNFQSKYALF